MIESGRDDLQEMFRNAKVATPDRLKRKLALIPSTISKTRTPVDWAFVLPWVFLTPLCFGLFLQNIGGLMEAIRLFSGWLVNFAVSIDPLAFTMAPIVSLLPLLVLFSLFRRQLAW